MVNIKFTMLSYPQDMYAYLQRKVIASLVLIALAFGGWYVSTEYMLDDIELQIKAQRDKFRSPTISDDIVVVGMDFKSYKAHSQFPWPRSHHAKIVDTLNKHGAERIFFDMYFTKLSSPSEDMVFEKSLNDSKAQIFLPVAEFINDDGRAEPVGSHNRFLKNATELSIDHWATGNGVAIELPIRSQIGDRNIKSVSSELAKLDDNVTGTYPIDYAYDWTKLPTISAIDVLNDNVASDKLSGKSVIYGYFTREFGDTKNDPAGGYMPGLAHHAIGGNQLQNGIPTVLDVSLPITITLIICLCLIWFVSPKTAMIFAAIGIPIWFAVLIYFESRAVYMNATPTIALFSITIFYHFMTLFLNKIDDGRRVNRESGLPTLEALFEDDRSSEKSAVISINFDGYDLVRRSLSSQQLQILLDQIRTRLSVITNDIYQGSDGSLYFTFGALDEKDIIDSLQGLKMFFVNPIALDGHMIALKPAFGYDLETNLTLEERTGHALVASCHAQTSAQKIARFDNGLLDEGKKHLSMQSTMKRAMENGELEVYIQPQIDIQTGWTNSGEALVRWNDPLQGIVAPGQFMPVIEKTPLISELSLHILELAIEALSEIRPLADDFKISVNIPPSLMTDTGFVDRAFDLINQAGVPKSSIVLEITERGVLLDKDIAINSMQRFVDAGIEFSIDDFGTANSNIEILRSIPAFELKIDQSFIKDLGQSQKDQALVKSLINMGHELDYVVVAEGVENREILNLLASLDCDKAQGYEIAKPLKVNDFTGHLIREFLHKRMLHKSKYG